MLDNYYLSSKNKANIYKLRSHIYLKHAQLLHVLRTCFVELLLVFLPLFKKIRNQKCDSFIVYFLYKERFVNTLLSIGRIFVRKAKIFLLHHFQMYPSIPYFKGNFDFKF